MYNNKSFVDLTIDSGEKHFQGEFSSAQMILKCNINMVETFASAKKSYQ